MNPLNLRLRNCRTFREVDLDLPEGLLAIIGSNGAGKSTLINAIDVALFGPTGRTLADWYPRDTAAIDPLVITLAFEHDGNVYRVRRSFSPKGRGQTKVELELSVPEVMWQPITRESTAETDALIERLIGLSRDTFRASSFLAQGEAGVFCEAQPRQRKQILAEILGLQEWETYLEKARQQKRTVQTDVDYITGKLAQADEELAARKQVEEERFTAYGAVQAAATKLQEALSALPSLRERLQKAQTRYETRRNAQIALERAVQSMGELQKQIAEREDAIRSLDARLELRPKLEQTAGALAQIEQERETLTTAITQWSERVRMVDERKRLAEERDGLKTRSAELEEKARTARSGIGLEHCDRCGQTLHAEAAERAAVSYETDAAAFAGGVDRNEKLIGALDVGIAAVPEQEPDRARAQVLPGMIQQAQNAATQLAALTEAAEHRERILDETRRLKISLPDYEKTVVTTTKDLGDLGEHDPDEIQTLTDALQDAEGHVEAFRVQQNVAEQQVARLDERLERLDKIAADATRSRVRRDELNGELDLLANMERACGQNGVPALILETVAVPQIEVEASRILGRLGGPAYAVELRTLREKKTGGIADTLDVILYTETGEAPYESFSGGERARIAFALRLALAQLLASRKGSATGLLVIDELEGLDADGIAALVDVLEDLQASVPRIIVVSHNAELRDSFANTIMLEQVDGHSQIAVDIHHELGGISHDRH